MIAIAVVASLVVYAWVMGYIGGTTSKTGQAIQIQNTAASSSGKLDIYVQNVGQGAVTLDPKGSVYVSDQLQTDLTSTDFSTLTLKQGDTATIHTQYTAPTDGSSLKIKVVTSGGTYSQVVGKVGSGGGSGGTTYQVSFATSGGGAGSSTSPSGTQTYTAGQQVSITATPAGGDTFSSWGATGSITFGNANSASTTATINGAGIITAIFTANRANPTVPAPTLTPAGPINLGASVTASVTISGSSGTPTGTVTFEVSSDGGTTWNTVGAIKTLASGSATSDSYTPAASGTYQFRAQYSGDSNYNSATGNAASLTVNAVQTVDHFVFSTVSSPQIAGTSFIITITAKDTSDNTVTSYTGTNTLTPSSGTISPTSTTAFTAGVWTGSVTLYTTGSGITIGTTGNTKTGTSNPFTVNAGTGVFGYQTQGTSTNDGDLENYILGTRFTTPGYSVTAQSITAYIQLSSGASTHTIKAAIYTSAGAFVAGTQEVSVTTSNDGWVTFNFASGTALTASTNYYLVVWSNSASGSATLYYTSTGGTSVYDGRTYGSWPSSDSWDGNLSHIYSIYCTYSIP